MIFLLHLTEWPSKTVDQDSIAGVAYMVGSIASTVFLWRVLRPRRGLFSNLIGERPEGWRWQLQYGVFPLAMGTPLSLAVLGYNYTALELGQRLMNSVAVLISAVFLHYLVVRLLIIAMPKLAMERSRAKREAMRAARATREAAEASGESEPEMLEVPGVNLATVGEQTRRLLHMLIAVYVGIGLWLLWSDLMPALGVLDEVTLWTRKGMVEGVQQLLPTTLGDLLLAVVIAVLTFVAANNLPGVLEISGCSAPPWMPAPVRPSPRSPVTAS